MTKKEAFKSAIGIDVSDNTLEFYLLEAGIDGTAVSIKGDLKPLELAAVPLLQSLLAISSESEGGLSVSYSIEGIKARIQAIAKKYNLNDVLSATVIQPKIRVKNIW